jgi:hypothetical protein
MRRSQPDHAVSGDGDDVSLQEDSTVRRFPRVGAQFQTRISKSIGQSIRPIPERMSVDFPHISEKDSEKRDQVHANGMSYKSSPYKIPNHQSLSKLSLVECYSSVR